VDPVTAADADLSVRAAQVLFTYAKAVDDRDLDALERILVEDAALTRMDGTRNGRDAVIEFYRTFWASSPVLASQHMVTNVRAFREDAGAIRADAYFSAVSVDSDGGHLVIGRYSDTIRDEAGEWRLAHKRIELVTKLALPPTPLVAPP
jgi:3-phenylpropionate/cinnamic acid dioxygenase small subunit